MPHGFPGLRQIGNFGRTRDFAREKAANWGGFDRYKRSQAISAEDPSEQIASVSFQH